MTKRSIRLGCAAGLSAVLFCTQAWADKEEEKQSAGLSTTARITGESPAYLGGLLGFSSADRNVGTGLGFNVSGGWFVLGDFGLGAFLRTANHSGTPAPSTFTWGGEALYRLSFLTSGLHAGFQAGKMRFSTNTLSRTGTTYGPKAAYDLPISEEYPFTVGGDVSLNFTRISSTTLTSFNPMLTAKLWF